MRLGLMRVVAVIARVSVATVIRRLKCISAMHRLVRLNLETNYKKLGTNKICLGPSISGLILLPREAPARPLRRVQRT